MRRVTIVDYGLGNLFSVARLFRAAGADPDVTTDPEDIAQADRLVLPGVGAFQDGMAGLTQRGLIAPITDFASSGRPERRDRRDRPAESVHRRTPSSRRR